MATGGTIPFNRTQAVTFYNTSGIVEKDKNIYYVPRFSKTSAIALQTVKQAYKNAFEVVCPPSSPYTGISISQWSPEDRTLVVKGNIDDFRAVTDEGKCLNYFIVTRIIYKEVGEHAYSESFYYAFFINKVEQAGGGSVRITCEPDDFTNVFYLHNNKGLSATDITNDYTPFNNYMANAYVARQHYDRVADIKDYDYYCNLEYDNQDNFFEEGASYRITGYGVFKCLSVEVSTVFGHDVTSLHLVSTTSPHEKINVTETSRLIYRTGTDPEVGYLFTINSWTIVESFIPANMKIFMNQEQTFKFKYQYRDSKLPVSPYDGPFTEGEMRQVEMTPDFENLNADLQKKIITTCINYLVVETKSTEVCLTYDTVESGTRYSQKLRSGELIDKGINRPNPVICYPFINSPDLFKKYGLENKLYIYMTIDGFSGTGSGRTEIEDIVNRINSNAIADYIYSVYILNNVNIDESIISISDPDSQGKITVTFALTKPSTASVVTETVPITSTGYYAGGIKKDVTSQQPSTYTMIQTDRNPLTHAITGMVFANVGILVSGVDCLSYNIELPILGSIPSDLRTNYYDPVLESEPYSFYSISSHSTYELIFNKARWFELGSITINHYYSVNGAVKESFIPKYRVESKSTLYFNEGLTFTVASSLPMVSDSYYSYYNQNKAQMKNQYAVADKNFKYDIQQHFFLSGPNAVGMSASRRAWVGAVTETGNQFVEMANECIDYQQTKDVIELNQKAKLADVGNAPDTLKQAGSDIIYDLKTGENFLFLNHYTIDDLSYNSIAKFLERFGYQVNLYDNIHDMDRVGWNYVQLVSFDWKPTIDIMTSQEEKIKQIFANGVTMLHDKTYLTSGHNYEIILEEPVTEGGN